MADINELKVLISNLGINIEKNHSSLSVKIDEVNNSISAEIKNLEDRAFREIQGLKESHKELQRAFDFNKDSVNDSIGLLRTDLTSQQDAIDRKSNELQIALLKLEVQSERVVQLEKVCQIAQVITGKDGRLTIKTLDGDFLKIGHEHDLTSRFPDFTCFSFDARDVLDQSIISWIEKFSTFFTCHVLRFSAGITN